MYEDSLGASSTCGMTRTPALTDENVESPARRLMTETDASALAYHIHAALWAQAEFSKAQTR